MRCSCRRSAPVRITRETCMRCSGMGALVFRRLAWTTTGGGPSEMQRTLARLAPFAQDYAMAGPMARELARWGFEGLCSDCNECPAQRALAPDGPRRHIVDVQGKRLRLADLCHLDRSRLLWPRWTAAAGHWIDALAFYYPARKKRIVGQAGKPDLLPCRSNSRRAKLCGLSSGATEDVLRSSAWE